MRQTIEIPDQITLQATVLDNVLKYQITNQSDAFTRALRQHELLEHDATGFSLKSHNKPNYSTNNRRFYVRGQQPEHNDREVRIAFEDRDQARTALSALSDLLEAVIPEQNMLPDHPGSTTACRMAIISRRQAQRLSLTAKDHYPPERQWATAEPHIIPCNFHFSEHIGQIVDVLNKAHDENFRNAGDVEVVNEHRVDHESCLSAVQILQNAFDEAEAADGEGKTLIAFWRMVSGLRAPDVDENGDGRERNPHNEPPNNEEEETAIRRRLGRLRRRA